MIKDLLLFYLFWRYLLEEDSYERDMKIYKAYSNIPFSAAFFSFFLFGILSLTGLENAGVIGFIIGFGNFALQLLSGLGVYFRVKKAIWEQLKIDFNMLKETLKNIFDENEEEQSGYNEQKEFGEQYNEYFQGKFTNNDEKKVVIAILKRFDLPLETNDMAIIKRKYRQLAKKYHPDMPAGNEGIFKQLIIDYETLKFYFDNNLKSA